MKEFINPSDGLLLIHKQEGMSSFGVIQHLQDLIRQGRKMKRKELPKMGHGGTLDPFATGLLPVCVGKAVKLARYFLGAPKSYEGTILFGQTTVPGDPTAPISETSETLPESRQQLQAMATQLSKQPYLQVPPMFSAKKVNGKPLYELARAGLEIERDPKLCHLYQFEILDYEKPRARFRLTCSSGTYIRTLAQDLARLLGTVGMLESLVRTATGVFTSQNAWNLEQIEQAMKEEKPWHELPCWVPFDRLLDGYDRTDATLHETTALFHGRQNVLFNLLKRAQSAPTSLPKPSVEQDSCLAIYNEGKLIAVARRDNDNRWALERIFIREALANSQRS